MLEYFYDRPGGRALSLLHSGHGQGWRPSSYRCSSSLPAPWRLQVVLPSLHSPTLFTPSSHSLHQVPCRLASARGAPGARLLQVRSSIHMQKSRSCGFPSVPCATCALACCVAFSSRCSLESLAAHDQDEDKERPQAANSSTTSHTRRRNSTLGRVAAASYTRLPLHLQGPPKGCSLSHSKVVSFTPLAKETCLPAESFLPPTTSDW